MSETTGPEQLPEFGNEPCTGFSLPDKRSAMQEALARVRAEFGREYTLWMDGKPQRAGCTFFSINPSRPSGLVGMHQAATVELAAKAVEAAYRFFPEWSRVPAKERCRMSLRAGETRRGRKMEFNAWPVYEAGKTWPEAEADTSEVIDFCEYYARRMLRLDGPHPMSHVPGEWDELVYIPLGVGAMIAPWNFPLAILAGMTTATLVTGNTAVIKPSSDTPTIAAKFAEVLPEARFPQRSFDLITGSRPAAGETLVTHPRTRFVCFTGSRDVGLWINELAAKPQPGQVWIKRVIAEMGGKDAIIVDSEADLEAALGGVIVSAYGYQGQKCSACSRAIVDEAVYEEFLERLKERVEKLTAGPAEDPENFMGPVINEGAMNSILNHVESGKREGRWITGGQRLSGEGYFLIPCTIADIDRSARIFREEILGPVLAVTPARDFEHALELANDSEYGLTGGVYTRNPEKVQLAREKFFVGNLYINRKCTGPMAGAHPFGGFNMSGTDSEAGGPGYLYLFLQAKCVGMKLN